MVPVLNPASRCRRVGLSLGRGPSLSDQGKHPLPFRIGHTLTFSGGSSPFECQCDCPQPGPPMRGRSLGRKWSPYPGEALPA